jgi:hypothetical protein
MGGKNRRQLVRKSGHPRVDAPFSGRTTDYSEIRDATATKAKVA